VKNSRINNILALKLGFRREEAAAAIGSPQLLEDMVRGRWLKPVISRHKLVLFDRGDIQRAWARILAGEQPPVRVRRFKGREDQVDLHKPTQNQKLKPFTPQPITT
jgi:hypothetical protein